MIIRDIKKRFEDNLRASAASLLNVPKEAVSNSNDWSEEYLEKFIKQKLGERNNLSNDDFVNDLYGITNSILIALTETINYLDSKENEQC